MSAAARLASRYADRRGLYQNARGKWRATFAPVGELSRASREGQECARIRCAARLRLCTMSHVYRACWAFVSYFGSDAMFGRFSASWELAQSSWQVLRMNKKLL